MELASNLLLSEEIKQTMGILPRNHSGAQEPQFDGYYEKHRDSTLLSCRSADSVSVVFCRSDHPGVWWSALFKHLLEPSSPSSERHPPIVATLARPRSAIGRTGLELAMAIITTTKMGPAEFMLAL